MLTKARKVLTDNGASTSDLQFGFNTSAALNLRDLTQLQKINEGGKSTLLRQGLFGNLFGFNLRESVGFAETTQSVTADYSVNGAVTKGATFISVDSGAGEIKAGTVITFGSNTGNTLLQKMLHREVCL